MDIWFLFEHSDDGYEVVLPRRNSAHMIRTEVIKPLERLTRFDVSAVREQQPNPPPPPSLQQQQQHEVAVWRIGEGQRGCLAVNE